MNRRSFIQVLTAIILLFSFKNKEKNISVTQNKDKTNSNQQDFYKYL